MCMMCSDGRSVAEHIGMIRRRVREHGWTLVYVSGDDERNPSFGYTVGLTQYGQPELIMFDEVPGRCGTVLNRLARLSCFGRVFDEGDDLSDIVPEAGERLSVLCFPDSATHLYLANDLYRGPFAPALPALQIYFPDRESLLSVEVPPRPP